MTQLLREIYTHMGLRRRLQLYLVLVLMLAGALAEMFTLGAVVPFLGLLVNPGLLDQPSIWSDMLSPAATYFGVSKLIVASVVFVAFAALAAILRLLLSWSSLRFVFAVGADFGRQIYARTLLQPYSYHVQRNSSQTLASIDKVTGLVMGIMSPAMQMFIACMMVTALLSAMLWVDYSTSLVAAGLFGSMYAGISAWSKHKLKDNSRIIADNGTQKIKAVQEGLGAIRDVIIDGSHDLYVDHFASADRAQRLAQANNAVLASAPKYLVESAGMIMIVALAYVLTTRHGAAQAIPVLGALAIGAQRLLPYMQTIYNGLASIRGNMASARDALDLLALPVPEAATAAVVALAKHQPADALELRNICYRYPGTDRATLDGVNLRIQTGEKVGFVGQTGSGKSTLIDVIMGLLPPESGQFIAYGVQLDEASLRSWQRRIAHVPQAIFLSDSTIAENIAMGVPAHQIDRQRLLQALDMAQLSDFLTTLPAGLQTRVGERGVQLSGGQRQRIGIARALYKEADVLVLDEATSALDSDTEAKVMAAIYALRPELVVLMIAHRVSTLSGCNRVYEMKAGRLHEAPEILERLPS
jgi:ABC-type multidrug transport system fused ATPase/permease subunit